LSSGNPDRFRDDWAGTEVAAQQMIVTNNSGFHAQSRSTLNLQRIVNLLSNRETSDGESGHCMMS
jgi:hypothetical protein